MRCALMRGALGEPEKARQMSTTPPFAARSAHRAHAGASLPTSAADPRGVASSRHPLASRDTPAAHTGGEQTPSPYNSTGCDARPSPLFSPPRSGFFILVARWKLLI